MTFNELLTLVSSRKGLEVCIDSRLVKKGDIFIAINGSVYDGHRFIDQAVTAGAKYVVCQQPFSHKDAEVIIVDDSTKAAAALAQAGRGNPASKLVNLAVTGTNGKTTVAFLVQSVVRHAGQKCGLIGTIIYDTGEQIYQAPLTTPDPLTIADRQKQMLNAGSKYMIIEASSHALSQNRLACVDFKAAAFTNLTGDHLDYHKTEQNYLDAKAKLFQGLSPSASAVLNKESPHSAALAGKTKAKILWYAIDMPADLIAHLESMDLTGTNFLLEYDSRTQKVNSPLLGRYNVSNHLAAAGLCIAAGFDLKTIAAGLSALKVTPGRLEKVDSDLSFTVLIDYAHTDDALKNVLSTLKPLCKGRLIVVFGCGGDRDKTKRPRMAKVVEQSADRVFVTSDNPRTELPQAIIDQVVAGFQNPDSKKIKIEPDRKKAIELAINAAAEKDIVLIAGKGHETYQIIGNKKFDFSDKAVALECLKKRK